MQLKLHKPTTHWARAHDMSILTIQVEANLYLGQNWSLKPRCRIGLYCTSCTWAEPWVRASCPIMAQGEGRQVLSNSTESISDGAGKDSIKIDSVLSVQFPNLLLKKITV